MLKKISVIVLALTISLICCGCWDSLDVNKKELAITGIVDKINGEYEIWAELANLSGEGENSEKFKIVNSYGETFSQARQNLEDKLSKSVFLGTVHITAFTKNMSESGIGEYCFRMRDLQEYRKAQCIITISGDPEKFYETNSENSISTGHTIEATLNKLSNTGNVVKISLSEILNHLSGEHVCFLLPNFIPDENVLKLDGYSVFRDDIQVSFIPISDAAGIHYLLNDFVIYTYVVPFDEYTATVEVHLKDKKIEPSYNNNKISFNIEFTFFALVKYLDINDGLTEEYEREVENNLAELILKDIGKAIETSQTEPQSDYFKMREYFRIKYPNETKNMDWDQEYPDASFNFSVNIDLVPGREYDYNPDVKWKDSDDE